MEKRIAIFPGSFDPITTGHLDVIKRAIPLFDEIVVAVGLNVHKKYFFDLEKRMLFLEKCMAAYPTVHRNAFSGLTVDFCRSENAKYILRGLRSASDFEYEKKIAQVNRVLAPDIETIFILTDPQYAHVSSTTVREIITHGGDPKSFLPEEIQDFI